MIAHEVPKKRSSLSTNISLVLPNSSSNLLSIIILGSRSRGTIPSSWLNDKRRFESWSPNGRGIVPSRLAELKILLLAVKVATSSGPHDVLASKSHKRAGGGDDDCESSGGVL